MEEDRFQRKIQKVLETHLDAEQDTLESLNDLSTYYGTNSFQNRRNLRNLIEKRSIVINRDFQKSFEMIKNNLDTICSDIDELSNSIVIMKNQINSSKALTEDLIKQTNCLQEQRERIKLRQFIANAFIKRFQLTGKEEQLLYGTNDGGVGGGVNSQITIVPEFFAALDRLETIRSDCRLLLQNGYETMANDILEEMQRHQECAMERLYRATQHHCRNIDGGHEVDPLITEAMKRLQERPVLFKYVIDEYAVDRRAILVAGFIEALMDGGPGGHPKPIEFHAHDPKRYIGDMFAWLHQALSTEKENLSGLLKQCIQNDLLDQMETALSYIADGICHFLRVRVETILNTEKDTIILFAIANLLRFYQQIMHQVVQSGSLEQCLMELEKNSEQIYLNALSKQVQHILDENNVDGEIPKRDLSPPLSLNRLLNLLKEILSVATMVDGRQTDIMKIVAHIIDPLMENVQESATHLPTIDMSVYLLNCLYQIQTTLTVYEYMDERIERFQGQMDAQIDTLTSEQATSLVCNLQLNPIYNILQTQQQQQPEQQQQTQIEMNLLKIFHSKLEVFLEMPEILLLPQIQLIISAGHRNTIQKRSFQVILTIYKQIYERIHHHHHHPDHGLGTTSENIFVRSPDEVAKLLGI